MRQLRRLIAPLVVALAIIGAGLLVGSTPAHALGQCHTDNVTPVDLGGGLPWDQNWFLDVVGTTRTDGYFVYYDPGAGAYNTISWAPNYSIPGGTRFGVSTAWGYLHPWWSSTFWRYVYQC